MERLVTDIYQEMSDAQRIALIYIHCKPNSKQDKVAAYLLQNVIGMQFSMFEFKMNIISGLEKNYLIRPSRNMPSGCYCATKKGHTLCMWMLGMWQEYSDMCQTINNGGAA